VPSDAVVAALDEVVPGMLLQKLVLLGSVIGAALGAARLLRGRPLVVLLVAVTVMTWNPFVVERLVIGHWPVLVGYGVTPWLVVASRAWRRTGRVPAVLLVLVPLGALSASAGVATAVLLLALCADRGRWRTALGLAVAANLPWVVSGVLHTASATTDALGAEAFSLQGEGRVPGPLAALSLGGIWNSEVVPASRTGLLGWVTLAVLLVAVVTGLAARHWAADRREVAALTCCWVVGWGLAVTTWAAPGAVGAVAAHVPGGGLLRDGSRLLVLCVPLTVLTVSAGIGAVHDGVARRLPGQPGATVVLAGLGVAAVLTPVALLPDAAWGAAGALRAVDYPTVWRDAREVESADHDRHGGDVLVLPASSYRRPPWNHGATVLDPLGRYLTPDYVASDVLVVGGVALAGEDPRAAAAVRVLARPDPEQRAAGLRELGISTLAIEDDAPGVVPEVSGRVLLDHDQLRVVSLGRAASTLPPRAWIVAMTVAWSAFVGSVLASVVLALRRLRSSARSRASRSAR